MVAVACSFIGGFVLSILEFNLRVVRCMFLFEDVGLRLSRLCRELDGGVAISTIERRSQKLMSVCRPAVCLRYWGTLIFFSSPSLW